MPRLLEFVLERLMNTANVDAFWGDLEERYWALNRTENHHRAVLWLVRQVLASLLPLTWAAVKRFSAAAVAALYRRIAVKRAPSLVVGHLLRETRDDSATFDFEGRQLTGRVYRITKRATVLVADPDGVSYSDGLKYRTYYVPLSCLKSG